MRDREAIIKSFNDAILDKDDKSEIAAYCFLEVLLDIREVTQRSNELLVEIYYSAEKVG